MTQHSRAALESAFQDYQDEVDRIAGSGDWARFADLFTEDATYREHAYGDFRGREEIRSWITRTMTAFPGSEMPHFPIAWHVVDEERGRIICEVYNAMHDPGDGAPHGASNLTILTYAGDGLWSGEEDVYNPATFLRATKRWCGVAREHGRMTPEAEAWLEAFGG
ncbi:nuclear transport factor 2 family protein [Nocardioides sp. YIM 152315]|uniref:nuclear transport factor 2 family protein n=1 Tax=Nocardioides sp. YIM 152315 TaxID=3031760 RepID=UPI0023DA67AC|nr:nuclear transport factor 2 family protein [Nocardioides sp. YIM 152315]MDF1606232.1 nuclear transport factor 2 family protein [Nocardioides sp. YIM 152315]